MSLSNQSDRKRLLINTEFNRDTISRDNVSIFLENPIPHLKNKIKLAVRKLVIPNTMYSFHTDDSRIYYVFDPNGSNEQLKHITIDTGKVIDTIQELADDLTQAFSDKGDSIDVTVDDQTKKLTFTNTGNTTIRLVSSEDWESSFNSTDLIQRANNKIGLTQDLRTSTLPNGGFTTTQHIPKIQNTMVYHLTSFNLIDSATSITPDRNTKPQILATVINNRSWGDNLISERSEEETWSIEMNRDLDQIDLKVLDDHFREVSLNGAPVWCEIETEYL